MTPPPAARGGDHPRRRGPGHLIGPLAVVFLILGVVFAYLLLRLAQWAHASRGATHPVELTTADVVLLGGGAGGCWLLAGLLLWWWRRRRQEPPAAPRVPR